MRSPWPMQAGPLLLREAREDDISHLLAFRNDPDVNRFMIRTSVAPERFREKWLAVRAVPPTTPAAFDRLGLRRVTAGCNADNHASVRVLDKAGMRREQHGVEDSWHAELGWVDVYEYAMLAREWPGPGAEALVARDVLGSGHGPAGGATLRCSVRTGRWRGRSRVAGWPDAEFDAFVAIRTPALLRFGYGLTGDLGRAEEVVQAGLRATYCRSRRRVPDDPEADVRRAVVAAALGRRRRVDEPVTEVAGTRDGDPERAAGRADRLLAGRSRRARVLLVLRHSEGWSDERVAEATGLTPGAVAAVLARAARMPGDLEAAVRLAGPVQVRPGAGPRLRAAALRQRRGRLLGAAAGVAALLVTAGLAAAGSGPVDRDRPPAAGAVPTEAPRVVGDRRVLATPVRLRPVETVYDTCPGSATSLLAAEGGRCYDLALAALTLYEVREVREVSSGAAGGSSTAVRIRMTQADAAAFEQLTRERVGERLAVVVDGLVYAALEVAQPVSAGELELRLGPAASSVLVRALGV